MNREQKIKEEIRNVFRRMNDELRGYQVFLFGSRASKTAHEHSDFDVGVYGKQRLPPKTFAKAQDLLEDIETLYTIDWVDLNDTTEKFRCEAMKSVEMLH